MKYYSLCSLLIPLNPRPERGGHIDVFFYVFFIFLKKNKSGTEPAILFFFRYVL